MGLRDLLKKKDRLDAAAEEGPAAIQRRETIGRLASPEFKFIRSDTHTQEIIYPPSHPPTQYLGAGYGRQSGDEYTTAKETPSKGSSLNIFRSSRSRSTSVSSRTSEKEGSSGPSNTPREQQPSPSGGSTRKRISQRLHLSRSPATSDAVPPHLPEISVTMPGTVPQGGSRDGEDDEEAERLARAAAEEQSAQWEFRATMLAQQNERTHGNRQRSNSSRSGVGDVPPRIPSPIVRETDEKTGRVVEKAVASTQAIDADIQEAIRLHEEGELERSTMIFGRLADPNGANNPLSQVLYGLALRHGWGCEPDPAAAVNYLSAAASNAAAVENLALQAGLKKGGAAKGELVLAIFELANCFRHGWGIPKDPIAAKQYYETAANLGDSDAMNEVAWCYLEGFGCKKDKYEAARYYRLAEQNGNKTLGNSWIWKEKYNPPEPGSARKK